MATIGEQDGGTNADGTTAFVNGEVMKSLGLDPETLQLGLVVASRHMQRGDIDEALGTYVSLTVLNPLDLEAQIGVATCALRLERPDVALQSASLVIGRAGRDPRGYLLSAQALLMLKETEAARRDAAMAIELAAEGPLPAPLRQQTAALAARIVGALTDEGGA